VIFYALAIAGLLYCESDTRSGHDGDDGDDGRGKRIYIHWYQPLVLLAGYALYVIVCANYETVAGLFCPKRKVMLVASDHVEDGEDVDDGKMGHSQSLLEDSLFHGRHGSSCSIHDEPVANFSEANSRVSSVDDEDMSGTSPGLENPLVTTEEGDDRRSLRASVGFSPRHSSPLDASTAVQTLFSPRHSTIASLLTSDLKEFEVTEGDSFSFSCYLWKRSRLYSKMRVSSKAWQLRWVTIDRFGFRSCRNRQFPNVHVRPFNVYQATQIERKDEPRLIFRLKVPSGNLDFQAPSREVYDLVIQFLQEHIQFYARWSGAERQLMYSSARLADTHDKRLATVTENRALSMENTAVAEERGFNDRLMPPPLREDPEEGDLGNDETSGAKLHFKEAAAYDDAEDNDGEDPELLLEWPKDAGWIAVIAHVLLLPLKAMLFYSIPDVRFYAWREWYGAAIVMCVVWLAIMSYVMSLSVEILAGHVGMDVTVAGNVKCPAPTAK